MKLPEKLQRLQESRKAILAGLAMLGLAAVLVHGIPVSSSEGTCYRTVEKCHGLPTEECVGTKSYSTDFDKPGSCDEIENITEECNSIGDKICSLNNESIGLRWTDQALVHGKSCTEWSQVYDLELRSC